MCLSTYLPCALLVLAQAGDAGDVYQDFRNQGDVVPGLTLVGEHVAKYSTPEPEGLRVTFPVKRETVASLGVQGTSEVHGDFEITGTYELFSADVPARATNVVGVNIFIMEGPDGKRHARIGRFNTPQGHLYGMLFFDAKNPKANAGLRLPTGEKAGQLRLVREGNRLSYQVKDGTTEGRFREVLHADFGTDDLTVVRYVVNTSEEPCAVDARLVDFRIHSGSAAQPAATPATPPPRGWWKVWLVLPLALAVPLGVWLAVRRARRARKTPAPAPVTGTPTNPAASSAALSCRCSGCGKTFRAKAALAGKKLKCPQCGAAVPAPPAPAGEAGRAPS
jgi:hypothetical protein